MSKDPRKDAIYNINKIIDSAGIDSEKSKELKNSLKLMSTCPCYEKEEKEVKEEKKKREPTERGKFMGQCMRKPENGGEGKDMKTCSDKWKVKKGTTVVVK